MIVTTRRTAPLPGGLAALIRVLPAGEPVFSWVRGGDGLVGFGEAFRVETEGDDRFGAAEAWWREIAAQVTVVDEVNLPGTGLVAFGSFAFDALSPAGGTLVVPRVIVGRRGDVSWVTEVSESGEGATPLARPATPAADHGPVTVIADTGEKFVRSVERAVGHLQGEALEKVVLARAVTLEAEREIDPRFLLKRLAETYATTWAYCVDWLVGATPELLVRSERGLVTSRVLAGTLPRVLPTAEAPTDCASANGHELRETIDRRNDDHVALMHSARLAESAKDLEEHRHAVDSVASALGPYCSSMNVPEQPFVLHLPNVLHLATDVTGVLERESEAPPTSLSLTAALHPSAAVCGTPRDSALTVIREVEGLNRGRYSGPVGWLGADGDGEWGIALRCAQIDAADPRRAHLFAGCGILAASDPAAELAESEAKLAPMRWALS